jgi:hypothetical protein
MISYDLTFEGYGEPYIPPFTINKKLKWEVHDPITDKQLTKSEYREFLIVSVLTNKHPVLKITKQKIVSNTVMKNFMGVKIPRKREEVHYLTIKHTNDVLTVEEEFQKNYEKYANTRNVKKLNLDESEDFILENYKEYFF